MSYGGSSYGGFGMFSWTGAGGLALAALCFFVMTLVSGSLALPDDVGVISHGVCFSSPESWSVNPTLSLWINILLIFVGAVGAIIVTKHYNFVPSDNMLYSIAMLLMCMASPLVTEHLNSGVLMMLVMLICFYRLFGLSGTRNSAEGVFLVFSLLSLCSTIQYGFLLLIPVVLLGCFFLGIMHVREIVAMLIGIVAPYWILLACGLVHWSDFQWPSLTSLFSGAEGPMEVLEMILAVGVTSLLFIVALVANTMGVSSEGVLQRTRRSMIHLLGFALLWFMVFDFTNMLTYMPAFYLCCGYECAFWLMRMRGPQKLYLPLSLFVVYLFLSILFECL